LIPLPAGTVGTIVDVLAADPPAYLVEFPDALGANGLDANGKDTAGVYLVHAADLVEGDNSWTAVSTVLSVSK